jgi:surfactin synthase thioesterase subunit
MPLTLFGHSFGGLMAYETALRLTAATRIPTRLIVSACPVPGRLSIDADTDRLPDPQLVALIRERFGGLPAGLEESPEFLALVLHRIRADLRLMQQCSAGPRPLLPVPISVFWSPEDRSVTEHVVSPWAARSTHGATFHTFEGGHFFVSAQADAVTACIASLLRDDLDVSPRRAAVTR